MTPNYISGVLCSRCEEERLRLEFTDHIYQVDSVIMHVHSIPRFVCDSCCYFEKVPVFEKYIHDIAAKLKKQGVVFESRSLVTMSLRGD